ncbi:MAG: hypothetical protein K6U87_06590 [Firmicutes bacterium]|nr:hypothetical protein [Bacillota bacterium]
MQRVEIVRVEVVREPSPQRLARVRRSVLRQWLRDAETESGRSGRAARA